MVKVSNSTVSLKASSKNCPTLGESFFNIMETVRLSGGFEKVNQPPAGKLRQFDGGNGSTFAEMNQQKSKKKKVVAE
jgi:hypothetical protein